MSNITGSFFNSDYITKITSNAQGRLSSHIYSCTPRHIIQHDRKFRSFRYGFIMLINSLLRWLIIIWHYRQYSVNSCKIVIFQCFYYCTCIVTAYTQQNRNSSVNAVNHHLFDGFLLFFGKSRCFGCSPQHTQEIRIILQ